jgi:hypothetical protein
VTGARPPPAHAPSTGTPPGTPFQASRSLFVPADKLFTSKKLALEKYDCHCLMLAEI